MPVYRAQLTASNGARTHRSWHRANERRRIGPAPHRFDQHEALSSTSGRPYNSNSRRHCCAATTPCVWVKPAACCRLFFAKREMNHRRFQLVPRPSSVLSRQTGADTLSSSCRLLSVCSVRLPDFISQHARNCHLIIWQWASVTTTRKRASSSLILAKAVARPGSSGSLKCSKSRSRRPTADPMTAWADLETAGIIDNIC